MIPSPAQLEGLVLRTRWFGSEFIPFDEMASIEAGRATLVSGRTCPIPAHLLPSAQRALSPPQPSGKVQEDGEAFRAYASATWSPTRAAQTLLAMATTLQATDVHLEAGEEEVHCRLRLAGELVVFTHLPLRVGQRLLAALKHMSGCLPYRTDVVQEGRIPRQGITADARASFIPTALGERGAIRLFGRLYTMEQLGLDAQVRERLEAALDRPAGLLLVAGPSGSGKTTTLYAALDFLAKRRAGAHLSLEDPVEQRLRMAGIQVDQVELCPERGLTAEAALAGALRQDVDVLSVGEIRSAPEAALALEAAHTGRLVLAGIHAGSPQEAIQRLLDLQAERSVLEKTLFAVLHQRLQTTPCPVCVHGDAGHCPGCGGVGRIRVPIAELLNLDGAP